MSEELYPNIDGGKPRASAFLSVDEIRKLAALAGYELRRKGRKRDHKAIFDGYGEQLRNCYIPHITCTASVRARTIKVLEDAKVQIAKHIGVECVEWHEVWEMLLLMSEHVVRNMKYKLNGFELSCDLFYLIDKKDYIKNKKNKEAENGTV